MKLLSSRLIPIASLALMTVFSACKKKCDLPDNSYTGEIKADISIFSPNSIATNSNGDYLITSEAEKSGIKMSTDGGVTKVPFNYGAYSILFYPTTTTCNTSFERHVVIDDINGIVTYTIDVTECETCDEQRVIENAVVIRAVPDSYQVFIDVNGI